MWLPSVMLLLAFTSVMANVDKDLEECASAVDLEELEKIQDFPGEEHLKLVCPSILDLFECVEGVLMDATGMTIEQMNHFMEGTEEGRFITLYVNLRNLLRDDLCNEDSQLYKDYQESAECYRTSSIDGSEARCLASAEAAFESFKALEDEVQEETGENTHKDNRVCIIEAYKAACLGAEYHEKCGQKAFDTYMQIMKRSSLFKYGVCTESQMTIVKNKFFDSIEMNSSEKDLFRLALELRKRRK